MRALALIAAVALFVASGCIHLQRPVRQPGHRLAAAAPPAVCNRLTVKVLALNLTSILSGGLGGAASTATTITDATWARYTFGGGGAGLGLVSAVTGYLATFYAARFAKECP